MHSHREDVQKRHHIDREKERSAEKTMERS